MMQQEDDYLDLTFQNMAKRIKGNFTPDQRDDLVDEMFLLVSKQIRESKKHKYPPAISTISVAPGNNLGMGVHRDKWTLTSAVAQLFLVIYLCGVSHDRFYCTTPSATKSGLRR